VEDQEDWLLLVRLDGILDVLLVLGKKLWVKLDISWLVNTVNITETSSNREVWGDWGELVVNGKDILWLSVEGVIVDVLIVDTILLTSGNTDFLDFLSSFHVKLTNKNAYHLEPLLHWSSAGEVLGSCLDVVLNFLLRQVDHVGGEKRLAVLLEVSLICVHHAVQPWEKLLCAVICVEDNWNAVCWCNGANVVGSCDSTCN